MGHCARECTISTKISRLFSNPKSASMSTNLNHFGSEEKVASGMNTCKNSTGQRGEIKNAKTYNADDIRILQKHLKILLVFCKYHYLGISSKPLLLLSYHVTLDAIVSSFIFDWKSRVYVGYELIQYS